ncbi:GNAT family N-acetyltransferase [Deinococcus knuensis]|uniref:GNAT family N-acetyltransferase n=1 Tax=Deinococcus knuensis TaxID=1837380 RepID=A0ABQ2SG16_9DEIO|nr:GNAT family N-acetyltransferase [Deinococcus knuensis]GGS26906.1 GNAT family N-acetyltransferase [Deinococcus knuensis]
MTPTTAHATEQPSPAPPVTPPSVQPLDVATATPAQRLAIGHLMADSFAHSHPEDPPLIPAQEAQALSHLLPTERNVTFAVWDGTAAIGYARLGFDTEQNTHLGHARITVHPQHRRAGTGRALWNALHAAALTHGHTTITFGTSSRNPAAETFARNLGATPALPMRQSRVTLADLDPDLLTRWQTRPDHDPHRLHIWTTIPDEYLTRMADMMMVMNTAPRGELEQDDWTITPDMIRAWDTMTHEAGETRYLMATEDTRTGQIDGYSEVFWHPNRAALLYQGATAVRPEARGQGLGKWLKAAMLEHARAHCPGARAVQTHNAQENAPMLGINVALGFTPYSTFTEWQLKLR